MILEAANESSRRVMCQKRHLSLGGRSPTAPNVDTSASQSPGDLPAHSAPAKRAGRRHRRRHVQAPAGYDGAVHETQGR